MRYADLFHKSMELFDTPSRALDVQLLMEHAFGFTRTDFWVRKNEPVDDGEGLRRFYEIRRRRLNREPMAYILNQREFYGEMFYVDKRVLIPRWETELLVETTIEKINSFSSVPSVVEDLEILDIGAGSGAIAITLAKQTGCRVTATDISGDALEVFKKNIRDLEAGHLVTPVQADLFPDEARGYDIIVSNPPYVSEADWQKLEPGVRDFEPRQALVADNHGLAALEAIVRRGRGFLKKDGWLMLEIGYNQEIDVRAMMEMSGYEKIDFYKDLNDISRVASARKSG